MTATTMTNKGFNRADLWRITSLIQTFLTLGVIFFTVYTYIFSEIYLDVEGERIPGVYQLAELSDKDYISFAEDFVNLLATYQYGNARVQFSEAELFLDESQRPGFKSQFLNKNLLTIEDTKRSQLYTISDQQVTREADQVSVYFYGTAQKQVDTKLITYELGYSIVIHVDPLSTYNPYKLVVSQFEESEYS